MFTNDEHAHIKLIFLSVIEYRELKVILVLKIGYMKILELSLKFPIAKVL